MTAQLTLDGSAPPALERSAVISACGRYRYWLERRWRAGGPVAAFYLCNPSTADALVDDPTVRKCVGFAERWGCAAIVIVNPFALRATYPRMLVANGVDHSTRADDIRGPANGSHLDAAARLARDTGGPFVAGWGAALPKALRGYAREDLWVRTEIVSPMCLGLTADGQPRHPLMISYKQPLVPFEVRP